MSLVKRVKETFKEKFFNLFMIDVVFAAVYLLFLILIRLRIRSNMQALAGLSPALTQLGNFLQQTTTITNYDFDVLNKLGAIQGETTFLFYLIPIMTIIFWCIFQGWSWAILHEKKNFKSFFIKFSGISVIAFSFLFILTSSTIFTEQSFFEISPWTFLFDFLVYFAVFYLLYVYYALMAKDESFYKSVKRCLTIGFKRFFILLPLFIPLFVLLIAGIFVFFSIYTSKVIGTFNLSSLVPWVAAFLVLVAAKIWYKIFFASSLENY